jgi:hypothetical protein
MMAQGRFVGTPRISELKKFPIRIKPAVGSDAITSRSLSSRKLISLDFFE